MGKTRTNHRWTEEEREILREWWPKAHEQIVLEKLGGQMTLCAVRYQAQLQGLRKSPERWQGRGCNIGLNDLRLQLIEAQTINRLLKEKIIRLETQLKNVSARSFARQ